MLVFSIAKQNLFLKSGSLIAGGSSAVIAFEFDPSWDGLRKIAVFSGAGARVEVELIGGECVLPKEVMDAAQDAVTVGVYGTNDSGLILPTNTRDIKVTCSAILPRTQPVAKARAATQSLDVFMQSEPKPLEVSNRSVILPPDFLDVAVASDNVSKLVRFKFPRYFEGEDMSEKAISILFENALKQGDKSIAIDKKAEADHIFFTWLIDAKVTISAGEIKFQLEFLGADGYKWQTNIASFKVNPALQILGSIIPPDDSWLESWTIAADQNLTACTSAAQAAANSAALAKTEVLNAANSATAALASQNAAKASEDAAGQSASGAASNATLASEGASASHQSAIDASGAVQACEGYSQVAKDFADKAETFAQDLQEAVSAATGSASDAAASAATAKASEDAAALSKAAAKTSEDNAKASEEGVASSAAAAKKSAEDADASAKASAASQEAAALSESSAAQKAMDAGGSASASSRSADTAAQSATDSSESAEKAAQKAIDANASAIQAANSAIAAKASEDAAAEQVALAKASATAAAGSAGDADASAKAAASSAIVATEKAGNATLEAARAKSEADRAASFTRDLGLFETIAALMEAYPTAIDGAFARVTATETYWDWDEQNLAWIDSAVQFTGGGGSYAQLPDKPQLNGVTLAAGNNALTAHGIASATALETVAADKITKSEKGNAAQVLFGDGESFQAKLDGGTLKGNTGETGATGAQGVPGADGAKGDRGDKGDTGDAGAQGIQGIPGEHGAKGEKGDTGADGTQGIPGSDGAKGDKGDKGDTGEKGDTGAQGLPGADGLTTKIQVNGTTYTHQNGTITLPNYPDPTTAINAHNDAINAHSAILWSGTQAQYDALPQATKNNLIIAAVTA